MLTINLVYGAGEFLRYFAWNYVFLSMTLMLKMSFFRGLSLLCFIVISLVLGANAAINYPGISQQQDSLAFAAVEAVNSLNWDHAENLLNEQTLLEKEQNLPPLSFLLKVSARALRVQNDEFKDAEAKSLLLKEIDLLYKEALSLLHSGNFADSARPTILFIEGGLRGYAATLNMETSPVSAANQGFKALQCLDTAIALDPDLKDAYLGSGLFNCILSKYPRFLKYLLGFFGKFPVNIDTGLSHLRLCAEEALYSRTVAKQYLIQFLSPYKSDQSAEKRDIFGSLESRYPKNPYFLFLDLHEALCFYPDSFHAPGGREKLQARIAGLSGANEKGRKYLNLAKWQYTFIDSLPPFSLTPDSIPVDRPFSFYPPFIDAARAKYRLTHEHDISKDSRQQLIKFINVNKSTAKDLLKSSSMNPLRKRYFLWRLNDGLK